VLTHSHAVRVVRRLAVVLLMLLLWLLDHGEESGLSFELSLSLSPPLLGEKDWETCLTFVRPYGAVLMPQPCPAAARVFQSMFLLRLQRHRGTGTAAAEVDGRNRHRWLPQPSR
jgi:hypothetical protein